MELAFVEFPEERNKRYVVEVRDILNFKPNTKCDFDPVKLYSIRWPLLKDDSGDSKSSEYFQGRILILAANKDSLIYQAKELKLRLPVGYGPAPCNSLKQTVPDSVSMARKASKKAHKQVALAMEKSCKERMESILAIHKGGNVFQGPKAATPTKKTSEKVSVVSPLPKQDGCKSADRPVSSSSVAGKRHSNKICVDVEPVCRRKRGKLGGDEGSKAAMPTNKTSDKVVSPLPKQDGCKADRLVSSSDAGKRHSKNSGVDLEPACKRKRGDSVADKGSFNMLPVSDDHLNTSEMHDNPSHDALDVKFDTDDESLCPVTPTNPVKGLLNNKRIVSRKLLKNCIQSSSSELSDCSYISSTDKLKEMEDKNIHLQSELNLKLKEIRLMEAKLNEWERLFHNLLEEVSKFHAASKILLSFSSPIKKKLSEEQGSVLKNTSHFLSTEKKSSPEQVKRNLFCAIKSFDKSSEKSSKDNKSVSEVTARRSPWKSAMLTKPDKSSSTILHSPSLSKKQPTAFPKTSQSHFSYSPSPVKSASPIQTPSKLMLVRQKSPAVKFLQTTSKLPAKKKSPHKKELTTSTLGSSDKDNKKLSPAMLAALKDETPLPVSKGKVFMGNDTWIKEQSWAILKAASSNLTLQIQNLAEAIWGWRQCATFSYSGGKSPKNPDATIKPAAPAGGVEVVLAFVRAKLMLSGQTDDLMLDESVAKLGKAGLQAKFHNCGKKLKAEAAKAAKLAETTAAGDKQE